LDSALMGLIEALAPTASKAILGFVRGREREISDDQLQTVLLFLMIENQMKMRDEINCGLSKLGEELKINSTKLDIILSRK
jgi:hypothetical protein